MRALSRLFVGEKDTGQPQAAAKSAEKPAESGRLGGLARILKLPLIAVKAAVWVLAFLLVFTAIGFLALPPILKSVLSKELTAKLHRPITIQAIKTNPFLLTVQVNGFIMKERSGPAVAAAFEELFVDLEMMSLFRLAPVIREIRLKALQVSIVRNPDRSYNYSDLIQEFLGKPSTGPTPRFALNNIQVTGGRIDFDDRPLRQRHTVTGINLAIPFISSLPNDISIFVKPGFQAKIDGAPFAFAGRTRPFKESLETEVDLKLDDLDLPKYLDYLPIDVNFRVVSGKLAAKLDVSFTRYSNRPPTLIISGKTTLKQVASKEKSGAPLLSFALLDVPITSMDVFAQKVSLGNVLVRAPELYVRRAKSGGINLLQLVPEAKAEKIAGPPPPNSPQKAAQGKDAGALKLDIVEAKIADGKVDITDAAADAPFHTALSPLNLVLRKFSWPQAKPAELEVALNTEPDAAIKYIGNLGLAPLSAEGNVELAQLHLGKYAPYYASKLLPYELHGALLNLSTHVAFALANGSPRTLLSGLAANLKNVRMTKKGEPGDFFRLESASVKDANIDAGQQTVAIGEISVNKSQYLELAKLEAATVKQANIDLATQVVSVEEIAASNVQVRDLLKVQSASVKQAHVELQKRSLVVGDFSTSKGQIALKREKDGKLSYEKFLTAAKPGPAQKIAEQPAAPWQFTVKKAAVERYALKFEDRAVPHPVKFLADPINLTLDNFSNVKNSKGSVTLRVTWNKKGKILAKGGLSINPLFANLKLDVAQVDAVPLEPYFGEQLNIRVTSGEVSAKGTLRLTTAANNQIKAGFNGEANLGNFHAVEKTTSEDFLKWRSLFLGAVKATYNPFQLEIGDAALANFYSLLIIYPDGRLNVQDIVAKEGQRPATTEAQAPAADAIAEEEKSLLGTAGGAADTAKAAGSASAVAPANAQPQQPAAKPDAHAELQTKEAAAAGAASAAGKTASGPATSGPPKSPLDPGYRSAANEAGSKPGTQTAILAPSSGRDLPVKIGRITLQGGTVNFTDRFIKPNYSANLTDLSGTVSGMSGQPGTAADVEIKGRVDNSAPLEIAGKMNPLLKDLFLDLQAKVRDLELGTLTSYSGRYLGYAIDKGKLSFDVKYKLENRKLEAQNQLILNQLTFGGKIESPQATKLPVLLAVALLKDRNGVIDVNLPVSGSLDDPQFSVGRLILRMILNLIVKAVTAPFSMIASAFGGRGEQLSYAEFDYGRAHLNQAAQEKLKNLAKALADRPALKLDITGHADPVNDKEGLRRYRFDQKVKAQKLKALVREGESVRSLDSVKIEPDEYPKYLKAAYKEEKFPKPRNFLGFAKDLPPPEMEKLMLPNIQVTDDDLRRLANQRSQEAKDFLTNGNQVAPDRIFVVTPKLDALAAKDKAKASRVDFSLKQ